MPVVGAVLTLDPAWSRGLVDTLSLDPRVTVGELFPGGRLAIVVDTDDARSDRRFWREMQQLDGVLHIEIAFAHLAEYPLEALS